MNVSRAILPALILSGCGPGMPWCEAPDLFPGMWSGKVELHNSMADIDTTLHLQLFNKSPTEVEGWLYHTEGTYIIQDKYSTPECYAEAVKGGIEMFDETTFLVDCLKVGSLCERLEGDSSKVALDLSLGLFGSYDGILDHYEELGDRALENFQCLR